MKALIIEEDAPLAKFLAHALTAETYDVKVSERWEPVSPENFDLVVLDFRASAEEGIGATKAIRCQAPNVVLIGLGMRLFSKEIAAILDAGADDYLAKPFSLAELCARIRALRRRSHTCAEAVLKIADLSLDRVRHQVERGGKTIELTTKEFSLLEFLMLNAGRGVTRAEILEHVWKTGLSPRCSNLVDVYVAYVRKKVDGESPHKLIHTSRGVGYEISPPSKFAVLVSTAR
jgi:DNA-binding response OmpR family regulator